MRDYLPWETEDAFVLRNNLNSEENFQNAISTLIEKHDRLFNFGLSMSGVQFIGLSVESIKDITILKQVSYFLLSICCLVSLFGSTLSYILIKFLTSIRWESREFVLAGIFRNRHWLRFTELVPYMTSGLFLVTINVLSHSIVPQIHAIVFNGFSFILSIVTVSAMSVMICKTQEFPRLGHSTTPLTRRTV